MTKKAFPPIAAIAAILLAVSCCPSASRAQEVGPVSFGVMADVQYADQDTRGSRHYRESLANLENCVGDLNTRDLTFTIQLGDIIDRGEESFDRVLPLFNGLTMPKYHVLGNHDFPMARQGVLAKLSMERAYYTFSEGNWRFVVLDTVDIAMGGGWPEESENRRQAEQWLERLKSEGKPYAQSWNGGIGEQQKQWLRDTLAQASGRGERVITFGHMPLLAEASDGAGLVLNHEEIETILESYDSVVAYFCGHDHAGGYAERNGIHHVTIQGMVEAPQENAYAVVDLYDDRIEISGSGKVPNRLLQLSHATPASLPSDPPQAGAGGAKTPAPLQILKGPYLQSVTTESIAIMWETSEPSDSHVDYGLTTAYTDCVRDTTATELHEVTLTGLQRDTHYHYSVTSARGEDSVSSEDAAFETAVASNVAFRFVVYGDTRSYPDDHAAVVEGIVASSPRFVVHTGDFVARGKEYWRWQTEYFNPAAAFMKNTTLFPCLGNHEQNSDWYYYFFQTPAGGGDYDEQWYSFDYGNCHFAVVDTDVDFSPGSEQYAWLTNDLKSATAEWVFVVHHHPAYSSGPHGGHEGVQEHLVPLYEKYDVDMVFSGHDHIYERSLKDGVHYVVSGGGGAPIYDCGQKPNPYRQHCEKAHHFCTLDMDGKRAHMQACHTDGTAFDSIVLHH